MVLIKLQYDEMQYSYSLFLIQHKTKTFLLTETSWANDIESPVPLLSLFFSPPSFSQSEVILLDYTSIALKVTESVVD